ncbi:serine hydrolase [Arenimonas caeni]|uniref:Serine hydrolase n=2 Tax=Arenimonas caeni TaxID=2058085 RepID=A0A2P6MAP0_9GAMM|nr:serine hydrolase [Arenimonas caeni]
MALFAKHTSAMPRKKAKPTRLPARLVAVSLLAVAGLAAANPDPRKDFSQEALEIERIAEQMVARARIPGLAMAIVEDGKVISLRGYGVVDSKLLEPVTPDTAFRVASLSKAFAGTLSAMLVREGAMDWDAPIVNQLPTFTLRDGQAASRISVRQILSHQVGLAYNTFDRDLEADQPYPLLAGKLAEAPLTCSPGECYAYQNIAFSLVGDVVFASTGDFYAAQVEKRIFHPLGMYGATFGRGELESSPSWARPHVRSGGTWVPVRPKENYYRVPPAAGVNASARDMAQWLIAQMGHRPEVLPPELLAEVQAPQVETPGEIRGSGWRGERLRAAHYGLGWRIYDYDGHTLVFHGGAVQGYRALAGFLPERDLGIVVLWNSESTVPWGLMPVTLDRALGLPRKDWLAPPAPRRRR